jgi:zinc protease
MKFVLGVFLLCSLCLSVPASFAAAPASSAHAPEISYERYKLSNGLEVLLHEDHKLPIVAVDIWYHVGPVKERAGVTGFAHLFEHMMFEGQSMWAKSAYQDSWRGWGLRIQRNDFIRPDKLL